MEFDNNEHLNIIRKFISGEDYPPDETMLEFFEEYINWMYKRITQQTEGPNGQKVSCILTDINNGFFKNGPSKYIFVQDTALSESYPQKHLNINYEEIIEYQFAIKLFNPDECNEAVSDEKCLDDFFDLFSKCFTKLSNEKYNYDYEKSKRINRVIQNSFHMDDEVEDDSFSDNTFEEFLNRFKKKITDGKDLQNTLFELINEFYPRASHTFYYKYANLKHNRMACFKISRNKGLYRDNNKKYRRSSNVIDDLLSINKNNIESLNDFFSNYGFFYPLSTEDYYYFEGSALLSIVDRIKDVYYLQQEITCYKNIGEFDYAKILLTIFNLIFSQNYKITIAPEVIINTCKNKIWDYFLLIVGLDDDLTNDEKIKYNPYNGFNFEPYPDEHLTIKEFIEKLYEYIERLYGYKEDKKRDELIDIIDLIKHFEEHIGSIDDFCDRTGFNKEIAVEKNIITEKIKQSSPEIKKKIIKAAKYILKEEIDHYISSIRLEYEKSSLNPYLKADSLISAIYFSISYYNSNYISVRRCLYCENYFSCNTSSNRKFCSNQCAENYKSQNRRTKERLKKLRNTENKNRE